MPADKDKTVVATNTEAAIDPRDAKLAELERELKDAKRSLESLHAENKALRDKKTTKLPENVVILPGGSVKKIVRTVVAKFALDEVKKGYLEEDLELIVIER